LEESLGAQLLERQGRQIRLTPAGEVVFQEAKNILAAQERMQEALTSLNSLDAGRVVVGASTIPGEYVLPRLAGEFKVRYPGIQITLRIGESTRVAGWLLDRTVDLGVVGVQVNNPQLRFTEIFSDELVAVMPAGHPLAAQNEVTLEQLLAEIGQLGPLIGRKRDAAEQHPFRSTRAAAAHAVLLGAARALLAVIAVGALGAGRRGQRQGERDRRRQRLMGHLSILGELLDVRAGVTGVVASTGRTPTEYG
jgi:DNA-binding transcriptional LysR family regulator